VLIGAVERARHFQMPLGGFNRELRLGVGDEIGEPGFACAIEDRLALLRR